MQTRRVQLATGRAIEFQLAENAAHRDAFFVLGVRKCGSSVMNSMLAGLAALNGLGFVDVGGKFFEQDVPEEDWRNDPESLTLLAPGQVYGGFRAMPLVFQNSEVFQAGRKILLVRDPRDALVSEYFSIAFTHSLPEAVGPDGARAAFLTERAAAQASAIEDFVIRRAKLLNTTLMEYRPMLTDKRTALFFYEDVILKKRAWVAEMAAHFGWTTGSDAFLDGMMGWADVLPQAERPREFIRRVRPGDHKEKLPKRVIERLDQLLAPSMALFGYS